MNSDPTQDGVQETPAAADPVDEVARDYAGVECPSLVEGVSETSIDEVTRNTIGAGNRNLLIVMILIAIAGASLGLMRVVSREPVRDDALAAIEQKIELTLAQMDVDRARSKPAGRSAAPRPTETESVIAVFTADPVAHQVGAGEINRNPFNLVGEKPAPTVTRPKPVEADPAARENARLQKLEAAFNALQLQSLLTGRVPLAVIDGEVLRVGDRVGVFTIESINLTGVRLSAAGEAYLLTMDPNASQR